MLYTLDPMKLGQWVRDARKRAGLSQEALGAKLGELSKGNVSAWENDRHSPSFAQVAEIVRITGAPFPNQMPAATVADSHIPASRPSGADGGSAISELPFLTPEAQALTAMIASADRPGLAATWHSLAEFLKRAIPDAQLEALPELTDRQKVIQDLINAAAKEGNTAAMDFLLARLAAAAPGKRRNPPPGARKPGSNAAD